MICLGSVKGQIQALHNINKYLLYFYMFLALFVIESPKRINATSSKCPFFSIKLLTFKHSAGRHAIYMRIFRMYDLCPRSLYYRPPAHSRFSVYVESDINPIITSESGSTRALKWYKVCFCRINTARDDPNILNVYKMQYTCADSGCMICTPNRCIIAHRRTRIIFGLTGRL